MAQEPGGGTADGGAGVQRGHAAHAGALRRTHGCHLHGAAVLWCWYGNQMFRL